MVVSSDYKVSNCLLSSHPGGILWLLYQIYGFVLSFGCGNNTGQVRAVGRAIAVAFFDDNDVIWHLHFLCIPSWENRLMPPPEGQSRGRPCRCHCWQRRLGCRHALRLIRDGQKNACQGCRGSWASFLGGRF